MGDSIQVRFRSTNGDVGPFPFSESQLVQALKEKLFQEWPKEGALAKDPPASPNDIKLILSGKYVDAAKPLKDYKREMGEIKPDTLVTMHMIVRPAAVAAKPGQGTPTQEKEPPKGCGCIIS